MISPEELQELESTLLPSLERHHLRLLAHGLRTLQSVAGRRSGPLPDPAALQAWALRQPAIAGDPAFAEPFLAQMRSLATQLTAIAATRGLSAPLDLAMADLIAWARVSADARISPEQQALHD